MADIRLLEPDGDRTHDPLGDPSFQESSLIAWHDLKAGVGGFWRVSQEPVNGLTHSSFALFAPDGWRFRHNVQRVPIRPGDRGATHMSPGRELRLDLGTMTITAAFPDCEARLVFEDFHPRWDFLELMGIKLPEGHGGEHLEIAGAVTGRVRLGEREFMVDGLGHRDRSWGPRQWNTMRSTRWWPSVFGKDLCVHMAAHVHVDGHHGVLGYVLRDGVPLRMSDADIAVTMDYDGIGARAAQARFRLPDGETVELSHQRRSGAILDVCGFVAVESIGTARWGDRVGMSNVEVFSNALGGTRPPAFVLEADFGQGLRRSRG